MLHIEAVFNICCGFKYYYCYVVIDVDVANVFISSVLFYQIRVLLKYANTLSHFGAQFLSMQIPCSLAHNVEFVCQRLLLFHDCFYWLSNIFKEMTEKDEAFL